jgi:hypothetical protein
MESRLAMYAGVITAYLAAIAVAVAIIAAWSANESIHWLLAILSVVAAVGVAGFSAFFGRAWLRSAIREARAWGESVLRIIINVIRLALVTRRGRAAAGGIALGIAIGASPALIGSVQRGRWGDALVPAILLTLAAGLNAWALLAAGSAVVPATRVRDLRRWEHTFHLENEIGPVIDLQKQTRVALRIKPLVGNQWRFGLKFSRDEEFAEGRYAPGYPLWHLQKEQDSNDLGFTHYDELGRGRGALLCPGYTNEELTVHIRTLGPQLVIRIDCNAEWMATLDGESYRFAQPTAWADGREFQIRVQWEAGG